MSGIDPLTVPSLLAAIDAALVRQQVIASNVANAGVASRPALRVSFAQSFSAAQGRPASTLDAVIRPAPSSSLDMAARVDAELVSMARNSMHHQALLRVLDRHLAVMGLAVSDGRR